MVESRDSKTGDKKKDFAISRVWLNLYLLRALPLYCSWKTCKTSKVTLQQGNFPGF